MLILSKLWLFLTHKYFLILNLLQNFLLPVNSSVSSSCAYIHLLRNKNSSKLICWLPLIIWMKFQGSSDYCLLIMYLEIRQWTLWGNRYLSGDKQLRQFPAMISFTCVVNLSYKIIKYLALSLVNWCDWMKVHEYSCHILCNNRIWVFLSWHNSPLPNCLSIFPGNKLNLPEILWVIIVGDSCR